MTTPLSTAGPARTNLEWLLLIRNTRLAILKALPFEDAETYRIALGDVAIHLAQAHIELEKALAAVRAYFDRKATTIAKEV